MGFGKNPQILLFFLQVCELNRCRFPISLKKWCPFLTNFSWLFPPSPKAAPRPSDAGFSLEHGALKHQRSCRVCSPRFHGTGSTAPQARPALSTPSDLRGFEALFCSPGRRAVTLALVKPTLLAGGAACRTPCGSCPSGTFYLSAQTPPWPAPSRPSQGTGIPLSAQTRSGRCAICARRSQRGNPAGSHRRPRSLPAGHWNSEHRPDNRAKPQKRGFGLMCHKSVWSLQTAHQIRTSTRTNQSGKPAAL